MKYKCLVFDIPWLYNSWNLLADLPTTRKKKSRGNGIAEAVYKGGVMDMQRVMDMGPLIEAVSEDNAVLFLWVTNPHTFAAAEVARAWGFPKFSTKAFTWVKTYGLPEDDDKAALALDNDNMYVGLGRWVRCLDGNTVIHVMDKVTGTVKRINISDLQHLDYSRLKIHTYKGWQSITGFAVNLLSHTSIIKMRGKVVISSTNHRWACRYTMRKRLPANRDKRFSVEKLEYLTASEIVAKKNLSVANKHGYGVNLLFANKTLESANPLTCLYDIPLDKEAGWLIGLFVAEGNFNKIRPAGIGFSLHEKETYYITRLQEFIDTNNIRNERYYKTPLRVTTRQNKLHHSQVASIYSLALANVVRTFVAGHVAMDKRLNLDLFLQTSVEFRKGFLLGLLDGDGISVTNYQGWEGFGRLGLCNKDLIKDVCELAETLGIRVVYEGERITSPSKIVLKQTKHYRMRFLAPNNRNVQIDGVPVYPEYIQSIEPGPTMTTYDISVDGESFIANGLISHNSSTEDCYIFTRGKNPPSRMENAKGVRQVWAGPIGEHSEKPVIFNERIEKLVGPGHYLDGFARRYKKGAPGCYWTCIGDELDDMDIYDSLKELAKLELDYVPMGLRPDEAGLYRRADAVGPADTILHPHREGVQLPLF